MTLTVNSTSAAQLASSTVGDAWLVELDFTAGTQRLTSWTSAITYGGYTYTPLGHLLGISEIKESEDPSPEQVTLSIPVANAAWVALAMGSVESYRGKRARLYLMTIDGTYQPVGAPALRFTGTMGPVRITRDKPDEMGGSRGGKIEMPISRLGMAQARTDIGLRRTHQQQQGLYPGDLGLSMTVTLLNQPRTWLSIGFQAFGV